jgi:DTW domain-containing protein YfiP
VVSFLPHDRDALSFMDKIQRAQGGARCITCHMHDALCLCDLLPRIEVATRLVLVMHRDEERKTTNTGRIAALSLVGSEVLPYGGGGDGDVPHRPDFGAAVPLVLGLGEGAEVLTADHGRGRPVALVVPDGTWRQAGKVCKRVAWITELPRVGLPSGPPSLYAVRRTDKPGALATMEAVARAFGILEGPEVQDELERVFKVLVSRMLYARGVISKAEASRGDEPHGQARVGQRRNEEP